MYADVAGEPLPAVLADLLEDREVQRNGARTCAPKAREHDDSCGALVAAD
jgi:hypothetical protein